MPILTLVLIAAVHYGADGKPLENGRTAADWADLAATTESEPAKLEYVKTVLEIENNGGLTDQNKPAVRRALLRIVIFGPHASRRVAIRALEPLRDESCVLALVGVVRDTVRDGEFDEWRREKREAGRLAVAIGGEKVRIMLYGIAREADSADVGDERIECAKAAIESLGSSDDPEAEAALKDLLSWGHKATWDTASPIKAALKAIEQRNSGRRSASEQNRP
jgi:hypothetical protein